MKTWEFWLYLAMYMDLGFLLGALLSGKYGSDGPIIIGALLIIPLAFFEAGRATRRLLRR
jgi:hypothetical protein